MDLFFAMTLLAGSAVIPRPSQAVLTPGSGPSSGGAAPPDLDPLLDSPEGYMAFIEAPNAEPPRVGSPPYVHIHAPCPGVVNNAPNGQQSSRKMQNNLCGDLNKGVIPSNPMKQSFSGTPELIKNKTLEFFSKALPILQADESMPKIAKSELFQSHSNPNSNRIGGRGRKKRDVLTDILDAAESAVHVIDANSNSSETNTRTARKFCDNGGGVMCMLYKAIQGEPLASGMKQGPERREDGGPPFQDYRHPGPAGSGGPHGPHGGPAPGPGSAPDRDREGPPPTPCPATVEYSTPVFARNYQGVWRYVVQIPYEGYFTQTVEVTRCLQNKCHYMDGACLSSPRWVSMLVAEFFYPDAVLPAKTPPGPTRNSSPNPGVGPTRDNTNYPQYLHKRSLSDYVSDSASNSTDPVSGSGRSSTGSSSTSTSSPTHCDGVDEIGCYQVRLYYDWFLIPGSCKCWRPDYFSRFVRRKPGNDM